MQDAAESGYYTTNLPPPQMSCDIKPRLTKEQHDILEAHFQSQNKPSTNVKKGFAENLNVSLDKINVSRGGASVRNASNSKLKLVQNWFQNRRAKSKQDAKKQAGAYSIYTQQQQQHASTLNFSSDSDTSPTFAPNPYYAIAQPCSTDPQASNGMAFCDVPHYEGQTPSHELPYSDSTHSGQQFNPHTLMPQSASEDMMDSPQDMNRRTLTQEQFDAFAQGNGMLQPSEFDALRHGFPDDAEMIQPGFPGMAQGDYKHPDCVFRTEMADPLSSIDSSIPSTISEQSNFPTSTVMQDQAATITTPSEWANSRSSSVSNGHEQGSPFQPMPLQQQRQQLSNTTSAQWRPGQSIPVDPNELKQHFEDVQRQTQQFLSQTQPHQQPMVWPVDEAFARRESQNSAMLAHQLDQFAIQTPQPSQTSTFKIPTPTTNGSDIASRRQRSRPAQLSVGHRSQSYSGAGQPASPSQQSHGLPPGQQIRKIRSHNVINGGVAQGRVMKSTPGSAQRSPMNWTFADSFVSNNASRNASTSSNGNLAPPTPLSPSEGSHVEHQRPTFPPWQSASGTFSRQASISELDVEYGVERNAGQSKNFTSPPHTPMYHHHQQQPMAHRVGVQGNTEYTPPQSAPAVQTSFPANAFMPPPPQPVQGGLPQTQLAQTQYSQQALSPSQNQSFMGQAMSGVQMQPYNPAPAQQFNVPATEAAETQLQFAHGVPMVNAEGQLTIAYPPQLQSAQFVQRTPAQTPPQPQQYSFVTTSGASPGLHITSQLPRQQQQLAEFFVHEYSPPSEIKRITTPRKVHVEPGPKNYTFANQGPEHFEKEKAKKADGKPGTASSSPASAYSCP